MHRPALGLARRAGRRRRRRGCQPAHPAGKEGRLEAALRRQVDWPAGTTFKRDNVRPGWQVKDGTLACVDPHNAGDIVTADKYDWFELSLDYNISEGGNSGIMFHVTNDGGAIWATGPEIQLEDNVKAGDPERCGWLYQLYKPEIDPKTGKPLDATKPGRRVEPRSGW